MLRHLGRQGQPLHSSVLQCPLCDFKCARMQNFTRHVNNHSKPDVYTCDECDYTNMRRAEVLRHKRNRHSKLTLHCEVCDKMFPNQPLLNTHMAARHLKRYAEQCDVCGMILSSKLALHKHKLRNHSSDEMLEKTHITCGKCGRHFVRRKDFIEHERTFHSRMVGDNTANENVVVEGPQTFRCGVCRDYKNASARQV